MQSKVVKISNDSLKLVFDALSGGWTGLVHEASGRNLVVGGFNEAAFPTGSFLGGVAGAPVLESRKISCRGRKIAMTLRSDGWRCHITYGLNPKGSLFWRTFELENVGKERQVVRGVSFVLPWLALGDDAVVSFPGSFPVGDTQIGSLPVAAGISTGDGVRPYMSKDSLACFWGQSRGIGVGTWFHSGSEFCQVKARRGPDSSASACLNLDVIAPLMPGEKAMLGTQYIWVGDGGRDGVITGAREAYAKAGISVPRDGLKELRKRVIYCGHPGGTPEQRYMGYGGFKAVESYLPTLRKMGIDLLWLLPVYEHGDGKKWNLYSPFDHHQISPLYGGEEGLMSLVRAAGKAGIELVFDLVPHGPPEGTELALKHPEWICITEDGKLEHEWEQLSFDNANPEWQEYFTEVAEFHGRRFGIVGARMDVATGSKPNWRAPWRPSHSGLGGGLGMLKAIRRGLRKAKRRVILLPEEYTGSSEFYRDTDITYDSQLLFLCHEFQAKAVSPEVWASGLARFLHDQALSLPPGAVKMRFMANHDVVSWTCQKKRPRDGFGPDRARALVALTCLIDGTPMIYQGEEDPAIYGGKGDSNVEFLSSLMKLRRELPGLTSPVSGYLAVQASNGVFACTRGDDSEAVVVLISFRGEEVSSSVQLPSRLAKHDCWHDALAGDRFAGGSTLKVEMPPHGVRILVKGRV